MPKDFDTGYHRSPFDDLVRQYPGSDVYPADEFRIEWGPVFHRGRLDGSARVLVIGQDPAQHETIARRILVGEAGQRVQGVLARLGITTSYVMVNTFLYSVIKGGDKKSNVTKGGIADYRNLWLDALLLGTNVEAVITFGGLAALAFETWQEAHPGHQVAVATLTHPTFPESASSNPNATITEAEAFKQMLAKWNTELEAIAPLQHPDATTPFKKYGDTLTEADLTPVPAVDMPAGTPDWMRALDAWAVRKKVGDHPKESVIVVTVPKAARPLRDD